MTNDTARDLSSLARAGAGLGAMWPLIRTVIANEIAHTAPQLTALMEDDDWSMGFRSAIDQIVAMVRTMPLPVTAWGETGGGDTGQQVPSGP